VELRRPSMYVFASASVTNELADALPTVATMTTATVYSLVEVRGWNCEGGFILPRIHFISLRS
jgi:hypothetical protein